jgi:hypothetical protein
MSDPRKLDAHDLEHAILGTIDAETRTARVEYAKAVDAHIDALTEENAKLRSTLEGPVCEYLKAEWQRVRMARMVP